MAGWRARIGVIIPSCNTIMEPELYRLAPQGVTFHFARVHRSNAGGDGEAGDIRMVSELPRAVNELKEAGLDAIGWGCTAGSFFRGAEYNLKLVAALKEQAGISATTTSESVIDALKALSVKRLAVLAPYEDWVVKRLRVFLEEHSLDIVSIKGMGIPNAAVIASISPEQTYGLIKSVDHPAAEAVFISCTDYPTIDVVGPLERDLGKPVISANIATLWKLLQLAGIGDTIGGVCQLLQTERRVATKASLEEKLPV